MGDPVSAVGEICRQLIHTCEQIGSLSNGIENTPDPELAGVYHDMRMDELEHAQVLILKITELVTTDAPAFSREDEEEGGGSVFAAGDLNVVKGAEKKPEKGEA